MADFILIRKSRNLFGSFLHGVLNIALGLISIAVTVTSGSWVVGVLLVFLSKWRVFAVRPRFWWLNIKANLVDFIVGVSVVLIAYFAGTNWLFVHYLLMLFYILWLTFIKPMSSSGGTFLQSMIAVFLGNNLAVIAGSTINSAVAVVICFVVGYAGARHILIQDDIDAHENSALLSIVSGLMAAELGWMLHSWNIVYTFEGSGIIISQLAVIATIIAFVFNYLRKSLARYDGKLVARAVAMPIICTILAVLILILGFSEPFFNI